uniref:Gamma-soluble NSF attachment protein n=2 Tax=Amphora coffeiformis TaxID=265554 RepID=A0A7S3L0V5_9STRA|eukprot:scaffold10660_cov176-Amphora_coffeaeformis.AAC.7
MSYKNNANANRDALFGGAAGDGGSKKKSGSNKSNRDALFGGAKPATKASSTPKVSGGSATAPLTRTVLDRKNRKNKPQKPSLMGEARVAKLKQAEEFRDKANACMKTGLFSKADPVAASTYYKRAADAYQQAGKEDRLERLYRQESAKCNMQIGAWASAAGDYTRAAELLIPKDATEDDMDDLPEAPEFPTLEKRRFASSVFHKEAAKAYTEMNEKAKAAQSKVKAAMALNFGVEARLLSKESLQEMEEAIEAHVPDVMNPYARYRQTGTSAFLGPDETIANPSPESIELAKEHIVTKAYSHEPLFELVYFLCKYREYASALYAAGAASALLAHENLSTLTLSRSFIMETIVTLAMGDPVQAEQQFLQRHVQQTAYLSARECKLAEDLFRAVKLRDAEALEEARSPAGSNRAALANLHSVMRQLVMELRLSGVARAHKEGETTNSTTTVSVKSKKKSSSSSDGKKKEKAEPPERSLQELAGMKTGYEAEVQQGANLDGDALADELDALNFDLGDDDDNGKGLGFGDDDDSLDDDDFDLR